MNNVTEQRQLMENNNSSAFFSSDDPLYPMQNENCAAETEYLLQQAASTSTLGAPQNENSMRD